MTDDAWQKILGEKLRRRKSRAPDVPLGQRRPESVEGWGAITGSRLRDRAATGGTAKAMIWQAQDWMARLRQRKKDIADGKQSRTRKVKNLELWRQDGIRLQLDKRGNYIANQPQVMVPKTRPQEAGVVQPQLGAEPEGRIDGAETKAPAGRKRRKK